MSDLSYQALTAGLIQQAVQDLVAYSELGTVPATEGGTSLQNFRGREAIRNAAQSVGWVMLGCEPAAQGLTLFECCQMCGLDVDTVRSNYSKLLAKLTPEQRDALEACYEGAK